jgi:FtsH-binding integral membrane protein
VDFLKTVGGKIAAGLVALAVIAGGISWYETDPATRHAIVTDVFRLISWTGIVLVVPWVTFFIIARVAKFESNTAGAMLIFAYSAVEAVLLAWLFSWSIKGPTAIGLYAAAVLVAAAYNLLTCDWIAERFES